MEDDLIRRSEVYNGIRITLMKEVAEHLIGWLDDIPAVDAVERAVYEQVAWERDTALAQLSDIGKGLGEKMDDVVKVVRCRECFNWYGPDDGREHSCMVDAWMRPGDWFCPCGRREE